MKKRVLALALALALVLVVGLTPAWAADTTGYYTATQIEEMGGEVTDWEYLLKNYTVKEANVYGWLCEKVTREKADAFCFYLSPNAPAFYTSGRIDGGVTTQEETYGYALDSVKDVSEKMYQYLTTDDLTFEEALGSTTPLPNGEDDWWLTSGGGGTTSGKADDDGQGVPEEETHPKVEFQDVHENDWYYEAVMALAESGVVNGKGNGIFDPNANITVGEMAALICRIDRDVKPYAFVSGETLNTTRFGERSFEAPTSWAHEYIMGVRKSIFDARKIDYIPWNPEAYDEPVRRGEAMQICVRFARHMTKYTNYFYNEAAHGWMWEGSFRKAADTGLHTDAKPKENIMDLFPDSLHGYDEAEHQWALGAVNAAFGYGIVHGVDEAGTAAVHDCLTRAEFCQMLYNMGIFDGNNVGNPYYTAD